jgi:hypothetical protein
MNLDLPTKHVLIPEDEWTPVRHAVFDDVLPHLEERLSSVLYLILYDRYYHRVRPVCASEAQLCRWTNMNERSLKKCLSELEKKQFIVRVNKGKLHSKTAKPAWRVPLANFPLEEQGWIAVPRFLVQKYCRRYHNAVLLVVLLKHHQIKYLNYCWPGVGTLSKITHWSASRINRALRTMGHPLYWKQKQTDLPWPLKISLRQRPGKKPWRHFQVRAVAYNKNKRTVRISREFEKRFTLASL